MESKDCTRYFFAALPVELLPDKSGMKDSNLQPANLPLTKYYDFPKYLIGKGCIRVFYSEECKDNPSTATYQKKVKFGKNWQKTSLPLIFYLRPN